jgi:hypothetical protein
MWLQPLHYYIDLRVLAFAGHVQRMVEERLPKRLRDGRLQGPRTRGRPAKSHEKCVNDSLKRKGIDVNNWKSTSENKNKWAKIIRCNYTTTAHTKPKSRYPRQRWYDHPTEILGIHVEKKFGKKWFVGIIVDTDVDINTNENIWRVDFDDGDSADYSAQEINSIICHDLAKLIPA